MSNNNEIINFNITRKHLTLALVAIVTASLVIPYQIYAQNQPPVAPSQSSDEGNILNAPEAKSALAALTSVLAMPSNNAVSEKSWYLISFKTATTGTVKKVEVTFPAGFDVSNAKLIQKTGIGAGSLSAAGQVVTYTVTSAVSILSGTNISIMVSEIVNPTTTSNQISVTTRNGSNVVIDGPTNSATFTLKKVSAVMIDTGAVTSPKIADGTITGADVSSSANLNVGSLSTTGSVGIGTASPSGKLDVLGDTLIGTITGRAYAGSNGLYVANDLGDPKNSFRIDGAADSLYIIGDSGAASATGTSIIFRTEDAGAGESDRMIITANGNVGIGSTNPGEKLTVAGSVYLTGQFDGIILRDFTDGTCHKLFVNNNALALGGPSFCPPS